MTETNQQVKPFPSIQIAIALLLVLILVLVFWPSSEEVESAPVSVPVPVKKVDDMAPAIPESEELVEAAPEFVAEDFVEVAPLPEVNVEELAAYTVTANVLLNLDQVLTKN